MRIPPYIKWPLAGASLYGGTCLLANLVIFQPMKHPVGRWEVQPEIGAEDLWLKTPDGVDLHGWWIPAGESRLVTLFLHGNAGNVSHRDAHIREIISAGSSILALDYRGYGKSKGRPSEKGLYTDAETAYQRLIDEGYRTDQIVLHGESLGTAVAVELAVRRPVGGVVLEGSFSSARDVAARILPLLGPLAVRGFNSKEKIAGVNAPLLFIHGERDEMIDIGLAQRLFAAASESKSFWSIPGAGHNNIIEVAGGDYGKRLRAFYEDVLH